jgi:ferredoxin/mono/diheme cytochrome c family protein
MNEQEHPQGDASIDWAARQRDPAKRFLSRLERATLALERPINRLVREPQLNPLYHTGTITVFLLILVAATGVYLTMFFQFGFEASYEAVARLELSPIGRIIRALHRYAADLALLAALLHGYRTFFMDRFRGPRWLAWVTGVVSAVTIWLIGVTGYWLVVDERAQLLTQGLVRVIEGWGPGARLLRDTLLSSESGAGWAPIMFVLIVHVGLSVAVAAFFIVHIRRLNRPKLAPPRFWIALVAAVVGLASIAAPVGMLAPASPLRLAGAVDLDLFFLAFLPAALRWPVLPFWGGAALLLALTAIAPWLFRRQPLAPVRIAAERCTGCTLCAADCPYRAIVMAPREDDSGHQLIAVVEPRLCVSCGVCIGSCSFLAMTLGDRPAEPLWEAVAARAAAGYRAVDGQPVKVVFTCERHAAHGACTMPAHPAVAIIPVTCIAMAHPDLAARALAAGAAEVQFIGCPPEDCANREGNLFMQQRLDRTRPPRASRALVDAALDSDWLPPDEFRRALGSATHQTEATAYDFVVSRRNWRRLLPAFALLVGVMTVTVALSRMPYTAFADDRARIEVFLAHRSGARLVGQAEPVAPAGAMGNTDGRPVRLLLEVDGSPALDRTYLLRPQEELRSYAQVTVLPGERSLRLSLADPALSAQPSVLYQQRVSLVPRQVLPLQIRDAHAGGDPAAGRRLFNETRGGAGVGCRICHSLQPDVKLVGPSLAGIGARAPTRVPGLSAEDYLRQALLEPDAYVVEGYRPGQMPPDYLTRLNRDQIEDIVAYLLTLE